MNQSWTPEEAAAHGIADAKAARKGDTDHHLRRQLLQVNQKRTALERLSTPQRNALLLAAMDIHGHGGPEPFLTWWAGFTYGFQLGHDYAIEHDQLLEDS